MFRAHCTTWRSLFIVAGALTLATSAGQAQTTTTREKSFEIISVDGDVVVVKEADGAHEYTLPPDFRFTVGDKQVPLQDLKPGMKGKATITTTTIVKPVTVTEVKNGQVVKTLGTGKVIVSSGDSFKMFSQGEVDKRGISIYKDGRPVRLSDLREGDKLTATFVTEGPPQVMTDKQVEATITAAAVAPAVSSGSAAATGSSEAPATTPAPPPAAAASATTPEVAPTTAPATKEGPGAGTSAPAAAETAGGGTSWMPWAWGVLLVVIVAFFMFRRSGS